MSDEDDDSTLEQSFSSNFSISSSSVDRGLSLTIKRQLLKDVSLAGGLTTFDIRKQLDNIIDSKPDIYGGLDTEYGLTRRKQIKNCVNYWKSQAKQGKFDLVEKYLTRRVSIDTTAPSPPPRVVAVPSATPRKVVKHCISPPSRLKTTMSYEGKLLCSFMLPAATRPHPNLFPRHLHD